MEVSHLIEITFKLTEMNGEYEGVCLNPKDILPDDLDDVILGRKEIYKWGLGQKKIANLNLFQLYIMVDQVISDI